MEASQSRVRASQSRVTEEGRIVQVIQSWPLIARQPRAWLIVLDDEFFTADEDLIKSWPLLEAGADV